VERETETQEVSAELTRSGIYTFAEAALLIGAPEQRIRAWIKGWPRRSAPAMVQNDLGIVDSHIAFSFANLMELRFIAFFAKEVPLNTIRDIMDEVRAQIRTRHPFATKTVFHTDGKKIIAEAARRSGASSLFDLKSKNFEMGGVVYQSLKKDVIYDPHGDARAWFPRRGIAPNVIIHPRIAFGRPTLRDEGIPTETIADAVKAEGSIDKVAALFEISKHRVKEAVAFEDQLQRAA
jgi:uncharacterized protein (DUF433 family)